MELKEKLINNVIHDLSQTPNNKTPEFIRKLIVHFAANPLNPIDLNQDDVENIAKQIEYMFGLTMEEGTLLEEKDEFEPWLHDKKALDKFDPYFWNRYKKYLFHKQFPDQIISKIDDVTDKILGRLENPDKPGYWTRRGMVVGHVQSGKTANFIGVVNKASDVGYKLIIILAGMIEDLRSQTQIRVDEGYIGQDSSKKDNVDRADTLIGVGNIDPNRIPITLTDKFNDFKTVNNFQPSKYDNATIIVVKKNTSVLRRLKEWLKRNNTNLNGTISDLPLLMIDDEADHASVNTNNPDKDPTAINKRIREILSLFNRKCYLAYTATPFANIFIDPDTDDDMLKDDLFPRDFIYSLEPPTNYVGAEKIFNSNELNILREINDLEDILPIKHRNGTNVSCLPQTLIEAFHSHIISKTIRIIRGQNKKHHSMLVHVSRFKNVQEDVYNLLLSYKKDLLNNIRSYYKLSTAEALNNEYINNLFSVWEKEFKDIYSNWEDIQEMLLEACGPLQVMLINGDSDDNLDYAIYKNGLNVVAVGGDRLSRGLTLEGLTTSYFYRNTSMYDTLMQMGRWFGYRDGYHDLCRIYLTPMTEAYFSHITEATEELRDELKEMFTKGLTPKDFGLKVRTHPGSLLITAKNKMKTASIVKRKVNFKGRLIESDKIDLSPINRQFNWNLLEHFVKKLLQIREVSINEQDNYIFKDIPIKIIIDFILDFRNYKNSHMTETQPLVAYLKNAQEVFKEWDVVLVNNKKEKLSTNIGNLKVNIQRRTVENQEQHYIKDNFIEVTTRRRVGNIYAEIAGMNENEISKAIDEFVKDKNMKKEDFKFSSLNGRFLRKNRTKPLLMLHVFNSFTNIKEDNTLVEKDLFAYGISFPSTGPDIKEVEFVVNTIYIKNQYNGFEDDEE